MNKRGILIVLSGPSGAGKGTVLTRLFSERDDMFLSVSATTRAPRPGEEDGVQYYFVSRSRFEDMIASDELLEHAEYCGNYYGTPLKAVEERLAAGRNVILEIEVQGAMKVKSRCPDAVMVFIAPPSLKELERRLRGRNTEDGDTVERRMEKAKKEYAEIDRYEYLVVNDDIDTAARELGAIIDAERCRMSRLDRAEIGL